MGVLGRSFSDPPMPMDLLEKRRLTRSNSDAGKESKTDDELMDGVSESTGGLTNSTSINNHDTNNIDNTNNSNNQDATNNNLPDPPIKGPLKTHVRSLLTQSNPSISSDDNDNDERETAARVSHPHHGARRWRQIMDEKNFLKQENIKVYQSLHLSGLVISRLI